MTVGQAVLWATDVDPKNENPELTTSEPYVMARTRPVRAPGARARRTSRRPTTGATTA